MNAWPRFLFSSALAITVVGAGIGVVGGGCDPSPSEPPAQAPRASRPPDKTEVTMEVSSAAPPGEKAAPPAASGATSAPASSSSGSAAASAPQDASDDPNIGGVQADATVEKAVAPLRPRLRACYKKALAANPNIGAGSATFDATIGGKDGHVASARFVKRDGLDEDMVGCLLVAVKAMTFDQSRKSQIVTLTFGKPSSAPAAPPSAPATAGADGGTKT